MEGKQGCSEPQVEEKQGDQKPRWGRRQGVLRSPGGGKTGGSEPWVGAGQGNKQSTRKGMKYITETAESFGTVSTREFTYF